MIATVTFTKTEVIGSGAEQRSKAMKYTFNVEQIQMYRETFKEGQTAIMLVGGLTYTVDATYEQVHQAISEARVPGLIELCEEGVRTSEIVIASTPFTKHNNMADES